MYTRTWETIIPVERETTLTDRDIEVMRWLARESFDRKAANEYLSIVEYRETIVDAEDIPPKAAKQLGRPAEDFVWFGFTAEVVRDASRL